MKGKMRGTRSLQIKRNYIRNEDLIWLKQMINRNLLLHYVQIHFAILHLGQIHSANKGAGKTVGKIRMKQGFQSCFCTKRVETSC